MPAQVREHNTDGWWYQLMHIGEAQKHLDGAGVTVAMLDGAIDTSAPELRGADISLRQACEAPHTHSVPVTSDDPDAPAGVHGTSMAAYVVGQGHGSGPGGSGILGLAPRAKLLYYGLGDGDSGSIDACNGDELAPLIRAAVNAGADIITTSTGGPGDVNPVTEQAIAWAQSKGVVIVASAGDTAKHDGASDFPAGYPGVVSVNAIDQNAKPWSRNPKPQSQGDVQLFPVISAPGVKTNALLWANGRFVSTGWMTGTSPAAAIVAGCLALVKQKYPAATGNQLIQDLIHNTGASSYGWDKKYGFGTASATRMLMQDPTKWPDVNPLLKGPDYAYKTYPDSVYGKTQPAASASSAAATAGASGAATSTASPSPAASSSSDSSAGGSDGSGGMPVWIWVVIGVVVVGGGGGAAAVAKGARRKAACG